MNKILHKKTLALLIVMVMLMATLLTACGSGKETNTSTTEDTTNVEATKEAEPAETTETEEVAEVEPAVDEPIAEPTPEPVVYEGIDMESTLPGLEWIETLNGVINEPKLVIFNDEINKKVIVENGQKIEFSNNDILTIYFPKDKEVYIATGQSDSSIFDDTTFEGIYTLYKGLDIKDGEEILLRYIVGVDDIEYNLTVTLIAKKMNKIVSILTD